MMALAVVLVCVAVGMILILLLAVVIAHGRTGMGAHIDQLAAAERLRQETFDKELDDLLHPHPSE